MTFVSAASWPTSHGVGAKAFDVHKSKENYKHLWLWKDNGGLVLRLNKILNISRWMVGASSHDVLVWLLLLVVFSWLKFDGARYP